MILFYLLLISQSMIIDLAKEPKEIIHLSELDVEIRNLFQEHYKEKST